MAESTGDTIRVGTSVVDRSYVHLMEGAIMPTGRIATVTPVAEQDAEGKVAAIFGDIKRT
jgi:hypothetical protein